LKRDRRDNSHSGEIIFRDAQRRFAAGKTTGCLTFRDFVKRPLRKKPRIGADSRRNFLETQSFKVLEAIKDS
jgi:hypothetical protein